MAFRRNTQYTRAALEGMNRTRLVQAAKAMGVKASGTSPDLIGRMLMAQGGEAASAPKKTRKAKAAKAPKAAKAQGDRREAGRLKLISGQGLERQSRKRAEYPAQRHGRGPFRYVIVRGGQIVVDAGPVPTARDASIAAKTLLRTKAKAFVHPISQTQGNALIASKGTGLEKFGRVVDGYVVENLPGKWEAFIYQPNNPKIAYSGSRGFDRLMPTREGALEPLSLKNVPDDFAARPPRANSRRKPAAKRRNAGSAGNKYDYLYVLQGQYGHGWEDLSAAEQTAAGLREIRSDRKSYRENEGGAYRIISRREART